MLLKKSKFIRKSIYADQKAAERCRKLRENKQQTTTIFQYEKKPTKRLQLSTGIATFHILLNTSERLEGTISPLLKNNPKLNS